MFIHHQERRLLGEANWRKNWGGKKWRYNILSGWMYSSVDLSCIIWFQQHLLELLAPCLRIYITNMTHDTSYPPFFYTIYHNKWTNSSTFPKFKIGHNKIEWICSLCTAAAPLSFYSPSQLSWWKTNISIHLHSP